MEMAPGLTREVGSFVVRTSYQDFPGECLRIARRCLIDGIGLVISGSTDEPSILLRRYLESLGGKPESSVLGTKLKATA